MTHPLDELCLRSLEEVGDLIAQRQINPVELTEAVLARVERLQPRLNAFITVTAEQALADAKAAWGEIAAGKHRGPLHGVPIAHKDLYETAGVRTTAGSKIRADSVPHADSAVVERLRAAGALSLGKLGMHEWAYGVTSDNVHFGSIRNPRDTARIPGGSSGGSGAAAAAGLAFIATGSDTGGSIRIPAAFCGCVGLMPTYGRVSLRGAVPLSWTFDHAGPLTRTVRDAAVTLQAIAGYDARDAASVNAPVPDYLADIERGPRGLRIGVPNDYFFDDTDAAVVDAVRAALRALESAGATLRETAYPLAAEYFGAINTGLIAEAAAYHEATYPSRKDDYSPQVAALLDAGRALTPMQVATALHRTQIARAGEADALLDGVDVLAIPTVPVTAPTIEELRVNDTTFRIVRATSIVDLTGQPAIAVPCGLIDGLPVSISFVARRWDEVTLLRAARAYELVRADFPAPAI